MKVVPFELPADSHELLLALFLELVVVLEALQQVHDFVGPMADVAYQVQGRHAQASY